MTTLPGRKNSVLKAGYAQPSGGEESKKARLNKALGDAHKKKENKKSKQRTYLGTGLCKWERHREGGEGRKMLFFPEAVHHETSEYGGFVGGNRKREKRRTEHHRKKQPRAGITKETIQTSTPEFLKQTVTGIKLHVNKKKLVTPQIISKVKKGFNPRKRISEAC